MVDGVPKVTWSPDLGAEREYRVLVAKELGDAAGSGRAGTSAVADWACGCLGLARLSTFGLSSANFRFVTLRNRRLSLRLRG